MTDKEKYYNFCPHEDDEAWCDTCLFFRQKINYQETLVLRRQVEIAKERFLNYGDSVARVAIAAMDAVSTDRDILFPYKKEEEDEQEASEGNV